MSSVNVAYMVQDAAKAANDPSMMERAALVAKKAEGLLVGEAFEGYHPNIIGAAVYAWLMGVPAQTQVGKGFHRMALTSTGKAAAAAIVEKFADFEKELPPLRVNP